MTSNGSVDYQKTAKTYLEKAGVSGKTNAEVIYERSSSRSVNWAGGKPSFQEMSMGEGICLRVLEDGAQALVTSKSINFDSAPAQLTRALEIARLSPKDPYRCFSKPFKKYPAETPSDPVALAATTEEIQQTLSALEKKILSADKRLKKIIKMKYSESQDFFGLANSLSVALSAKSSAFSFVVEILAEQDGQTEVGWDFQLRRFKKELDLDAVARSVATHTLQSLGGKPIPSGSYPVVVHPRVGTQLLSLVTDALSAEAVQLDRSFWRKSLGTRVASEGVSLIDDPHLPNGVASIPFDHEGVPGEKIISVEKGVLKEFFYDLRSASRAKKTSNGRGLKPSLGSAPKPSATNFYMAAGKQPHKTLLGSHKKVFHLHDVMGLHMADPITGEFSLGASGALYENGQFSKPVRGVTVAGTVGNILSKIVSIGDDLTWYGSHGCPSFLVDPMTIAGI